MQIKIVKQFGNLRVGEIHDREDGTATKLIRLGYAIPAAAAKELKQVETKELKGLKTK